MAQFILSEAEVIGILRQHFMLPNTVDVIVQRTDAQDTPDTEGWIEVPNSHDLCEAPDSAKQFSWIQVMFKDGVTQIGSPHDWDISWKQDATVRNRIVRFRPSYVSWG